MNRRLAAFLVAAICLPACGDGGGGGGSGSAGPVSLTVTQGSSSGQVAAGSTVHVWADPAGPDQVFDGWTGDVAGLDDPESASARLLMPAGTVHLTATYRSSPAWTPVLDTQATIPALSSSVQAWSYFPSSPLGVVLLFHGRGGSGSNWFSNAENLILARDVVADGLGIVALDSNDRVIKEWDVTLSAANVDFQNVNAALDAFIARGLMGATTSIYCLGTSNGGSMSPRVALWLSTQSSPRPARASAVYIAESQAIIMGNTNIPNTWGLARNDGTGVTIQGAQDNFGILSGRGIDALFWINEPSPVYPERFWRISGLTADDSRTIQASLKSAGYLDAQDYFVGDPTLTGPGTWTDAVPPPYDTPPLINQIQKQLDVCDAQHQFFSDINRRTLRFFAAYP